jgi:hypothetical protein
MTVRSIGRHRRGGWAAVLGLGAGLFAGPATAGSFDLFADIQGSYKITTTYSLAARMQDAHGALFDGEIDEFQSGVAPNDEQLIGFTHTGLPTTINLDDGNRNFDRHSPINNRLSAVYELSLRRENIGLVYSGSAFYDWVFHERTDRDPVDPDDPNDYAQNTLACSADRENCEFDRFTDGARYYNGERSRTLDAFVYGDFMLGDTVALSLRFGKHLVAWGESLFFPNIASAQSPNDATKAFVPGAEIKEILLPVHQVSATVAFGYDFTLMGFYQLDYKPTEVFPVGDFFSIADVVGPGAEMAYGSANPAFGDNCPGLLGPLSFLCQSGGGIGGTLINAPRTIDVPREDDIRPDKDGQWGLGFKAQITPVTSLGAYYLRYHNHNPTVNLNFGFARIGDDPVTGEPITTETFNQSVPVSYNVKYFGDIEMMAMSWSTTLFGLNFAGDVSYRDGIDTSAAAEISGVLSPVFTRAEAWQANLSSLYVTNPRTLFFDEIVVVAEASYVYIDDVDPIPAFNGQEPRGDGRQLFYDRNAWALQVLMLPKGRNVFPGWDIGTPIAYAHAVNGHSSIAGSFGALFGEGDRRIGVSVSAQYLQNLEFVLGYNWFLGNPARTVRDSPIPSNPVVDRDYATFTIKYNL